MVKKIQQTYLFPMKGAKSHDSIPNLPTFSANLQELEQPVFLPTPSPSPTLAPALPQVTGSPVVWFAGPEGPRRVLTEAELLVEPSEPRSCGDFHIF